MESRYLENRDYFLYAFFQRVSADAILKGKISALAFPKELFEVLCRMEMRHLSETEIDRYYSYMGEKTDSYTMENCLNVFRLLKNVSRELLLIRNGEPESRYEKLLRWRELSRGLGEDLLICAFLADKSENCGEVWNDFEWDTVISHDNAQLHRIMQRGIADNHFHLFGSAPAFELCWLKLMNQPFDSRYSSYLRRMSASRRAPDVGEQEDTLEYLYLKATAIRFLLYYYLFLEEAKSQEELRYFYSAREQIQDFLTDRELLVRNYEKLTVSINGFRAMAETDSELNQVDYALRGMTARSENHDFEGERALLYRMLCGHAGGHKIPDYLMNWFYAYLVIKGKYYRELVQVNDTIGFENFHQYSGRRSGILFSGRDEARMVKHAVGESLKNGNVKSLEIRISPWETVSQNRSMILRYDNYINSVNLPNGSERCYYYVFHFPKRADEDLKRKISDEPQREGLMWTCRHDAFRKKLSRMGEALIRFRTQAQEQAARVLGIDACSMEIGCRPEVFGPVFRRLSSHVVARPNVYQVKQWKITYHVGEDFLDFTDGLRAIDEAVIFLKLENGDRLGHATALGLDVEKWYGVKKNTVTLSLQDYLDNVVWLYHKLLEYDISSCETLKGFLLQQYEEAFGQLYGQYLNDDFVDAVSQKLCRESQGKEESFYFRNAFSHFDINTYYAAWKLRGDDPTPYRNEEIVSSRRFPYIVNDALKDGDEIRSRARVVILYRYYHYSTDVRREGAKTKVVTLPDFYVQGVQKVQRAMQRMIAARGICVEANPSSNYLISTMRSYEEHPISNFFNIGLELEPDRLRKCPQLHVSVNTDDRGVFHTSLENEFALMSCAMEKAVDEAGEIKYSRQMVYDWMDRIREMGNQQSFLERL